MLALAIVASSVPASEPVVRVEEDWLLVLNDPNDAVDSPQFHTVMSPLPDADSFFAQVVWNYREFPDFAPGGLELQSWDGETCLRSRDVRTTPLSTAAETIAWTQALELAPSGLYFEIIDGQSTTWGEFGRDMRLDQGGDLEDLGGYDPAVSATHSCITYGSNRVDRLVITAVRAYGSDGLLWVDETPRTVYERDEEDD